LRASAPPHLMPQNEQFLREVPTVSIQFPELKPIDKNGTTILKGSLVLRDETGEELDRYQIEIHSTATYPGSFPIVYEVDGRIPKNIDWHVYDSGACCLAVPAEERLECHAGIDLPGFIRKQVTGFFFNQTFRRKNGYFYQERAHGLWGKLQFYEEYLALDIKAVPRALAIIAAGREPGSHSKCFCGSNRKFMKCHRHSLRKLDRIAGGIVKEDYMEIQKILDHFQN
jgi:hypothetical protein